MLPESSSSLWTYYPRFPSFWVPVAGSIIFGLATSAHGYLLFLHQAWFFVPMCIGSSMELIGFIARANAATDLFNREVFLLQHYTLYFGPSFVAAACYGVFGLIVSRVTPAPERTLRTLWCPPRHTKHILLGIHIVGAFFIFLGVSFLEKAMDNDDLVQRAQGRIILGVGLIFQLMCAALFAVIWVRYTVSSRRWTGSSEQQALRAREDRLSIAVMVASTLILFRNVYRLAECFSGEEDYLRKYEWPLWVFDGLFVFVAIVVLAIVYPARFLPLQKNDWESKDSIE
ncbi:unnamed protein product [Periconia digitata]|uniref:RTA1 domain protein n=1 Tax=Periconia digitata TaxID=1303443 RepID=A0A9W4UJC9_9PLEO|nr:unnamed protein product [Periconia digitata]